MTEDQANRIWERMYAAEVRSYYFGDLASHYSRANQIVAAISFIASSGAVVTIATHWPKFALISSSLSAAAAAYSIGVGLERKAMNMAKLQNEWSRIAADLEGLWNHWYEDDAEAKFTEVLERMRAASQTASTDAPYDEGRMAKWQERVNLLHGYQGAG